MKELLTKRFWQDVKKTFHEALEGPPPAKPGDSPSAKPDSPSPAEAAAADHPENPVDGAGQ